MPDVLFPYGKKTIKYNFPPERFLGELVSTIQKYQPPAPQEEIVRAALQNPIGTPRLRELSRDKKNVVIIASDHTRPVPSRIIIPQMLQEIRAGNPGADITILIATGCHRDTSREELRDKFGDEVFSRERIVIHNCETSGLVSCGKLPSGGELVLNKLALDADLLVSEGFIEPHFFAGFSGGRKSVLPGVASRKTVLYNHNAEFIADPRSRAGILQENPIHGDMVYAARKAKLAFICNVVINAEKEVVYAAAGDCEKAHLAGCDFLLNKCKAHRTLSDIAVVTNGGYPLDQNIYQAVKGMTAAEATVREGGVIIMLAQSADGHGGESFYQTFSQEKDASVLMRAFLDTPKDQTRVDQWQSQIFARVLLHASVIYVSDAPDAIVRDLHMTPAHSVGEALNLAEDMLQNPNASIVAIPDGVSVIVV